MRVCVGHSNFSLYHKSTTWKYIICLCHAKLHMLIVSWKCIGPLLFIELPIARETFSYDENKLLLYRSAGMPVTWSGLCLLGRQHGSFLKESFPSCKTLIPCTSGLCDALDQKNPSV